jgi:hypothetical protein
VVIVNESTQTELLPLEGSKSALWIHFGFPANVGRIVENKKSRKEVPTSKSFQATELIFVFISMHIIHKLTYLYHHQVTLLFLNQNKP